MIAKAISKKFLMIVMVVATSNGGTIAFDSIASDTNPGPSPHPIVQAIRSAVELNEYCAAVNYDTAELATQPDFAEKTIIALIFMKGGGNRLNYRLTQQIVDDGDTVFLEFSRKTTYYDEDISIQAAYAFILFSIPRTDKPIAIREVPTSVGKPALRKSETRLVSRKSQSIYDGQGRLVPNRNGKYPGVVVFSRDFRGGKKLILGKRLCSGKSISSHGHESP